MAKAPASKQVLSLAQGIVHWAPPPAATALASKLLAAGEGVHGYGLAGICAQQIAPLTPYRCNGFLALPVTVCVFQMLAVIKAHV